MGRTIFTFERDTGPDGSPPSRWPQWLAVVLTLVGIGLMLYFELLGENRHAR